MQLQATIGGCVILASACFSISLNNLNEKSRFYRGSRIDSSLSSLPASSWLCTKAGAEFVVDTRLLYQEKANLDSYSRFHWLANGARLIFGDSLALTDVELRKWDLDWRIGLRLAMDSGSDTDVVRYIRSTAAAMDLNPKNVLHIFPETQQEKEEATCQAAAANIENTHRIIPKRSSKSTKQIGKQIQTAHLKPRFFFTGLKRLTCYGNDVYLSRYTKPILARLQLLLSVRSRFPSVVCFFFRNLDGPFHTSFIVPLVSCGVITTLHVK